VEYAALIFGYIVKAMVKAFHFIRQNLSVALGIAIVLPLFVMVTSQLVFSARPMCSLPTASPMIPLCHREVFNEPPAHTSAGRPVRWADYPKLVYLQTRTFDQLLDDSVGYGRLVLKMKQAEITRNNLITSAKVSDLKGGSDLERNGQIIGGLGRLADCAGGTGESLHSLRTKIQRAVDS
jgi:hypothetical protein